MKKKLTIEGMSCNHCVMHVTNALKEVKGVKNAEVSLKNKSAVVDFEGVSDEQFKAAVADAGYTVTKIE